MYRNLWKVSLLLLLSSNVMATENLNLERNLQFITMHGFEVKQVVSFIQKAHDYNQVRRNPLPQLLKSEQVKVIEYMKKNGVKELPEIKYDSNEINFKVGSYEVRTFRNDYLLGRYEINGHYLSLAGKNIEQQIEATNLVLDEIDMIGKVDKIDFSILSSAIAEDISSLKARNSLLLGIIYLNLQKEASEKDFSSLFKASLGDIKAKLNSCEAARNNPSSIEATKASELLEMIKSINGSGTNEEAAIIRNLLKKKFNEEFKGTESVSNFMTEKAVEEIANDLGSNCSEKLKRWEKIAEADAKEYCDDYQALNECMSKYAVLKTRAAVEAGRNILVPADKQVEQEKKTQKIQGR